MKKHHVLTLLFLLLLAGGAILWTLTTPSPGGVAEAAAVPAPTTAPILEEPCPVALAPKAAPTKNNYQASDSTLQAEIAFFNQKSSLPFTKQFHDAGGTRFPSKHQFKRTPDGFKLELTHKSIITTPSLEDGCLYLSGGFSSREFYAIDVATGKARWAMQIDDDGPSSTLVLDSMVIFNTESCTIFALEKRSGKVLWAKWIGDPLLSHPITDGKTVFTSYPQWLGESKGNFKHLIPSHPFAALDARTGRVKWQRWLDGDVMTSPVLHGDDIYLTSFSGTMYRLSKHDGKILAANKIQATSLPTVVKDHIYTTQRRIEKGKIHEAIVELDRATLQPTRTFRVHPAPYLDYDVQSKTHWKETCSAWDAQNGFVWMPATSEWERAAAIVGQSNVSSLQNFVGSTVVVDSNRLYSTMGDQIVCVDLTNGETKWTHDLDGDVGRIGGHMATMPVVSGNHIVSVTVGGFVLIMDKQTGAVEQAHALEEQVRNQPLLVNGSIYVTTNEGEVICVNTGLQDLDGWPMFLKNNAHDCGS